MSPRFDVIIVGTGFASAFFVVRARDTAGNEDHNTIQRMAVTDCPAPLNIRR